MVVTKRISYLKSKLHFPLIETMLYMVVTHKSLLYLDSTSSCLHRNHKLFHIDFLLYILNLFLSTWPFPSAFRLLLKKNKPSFTLLISLHHHPLSMNMTVKLSKPLPTVSFSPLTHSPAYSILDYSHHTLNSCCGHSDLHAIKY